MLFVLSFEIDTLRDGIESGAIEMRFDGEVILDSQKGGLSHLIQEVRR